LNKFTNIAGNFRNTKFPGSAVINVEWIEFQVELIDHNGHMLIRVCSMIIGTGEITQSLIAVGSNGSPVNVAYTLESLTGNPRPRLGCSLNCNVASGFKKRALNYSL
jgi:hypothetical protein